MGLGACIIQGAVSPSPVFLEASIKAMSLEKPGMDPGRAGLDPRRNEDA